MIYRDDAFAIMRFAQTCWMVHVDASYASHPMSALLQAATPRGAGCEIRLHGCDPDAAERRARDGDFAVMAGAKDRPHGLREAFLVDGDGYVWVPSVLKASVLAKSAA